MVGSTSALAAALESTASFAGSGPVGFTRTPCELDLGGWVLTMIGAG